jgi:hypothetical protein
MATENKHHGGADIKPGFCAATVTHSCEKSFSRKTLSLK